VPKCRKGKEDHPEVVDTSLTLLLLVVKTFFCPAQLWKWLQGLKFATSLMCTQRLRFHDDQSRTAMRPSPAHERVANGCPLVVRPCCHASCFRLVGSKRLRWYLYMHVDFGRYGLSEQASLAGPQKSPCSAADMHERRHRVPPSLGRGWVLLLVWRASMPALRVFAVAETSLYRTWRSTGRRECQSTPEVIGKKHNIDLGQDGTGHCRQQRAPPSLCVSSFSR
jgi:hypothetical protein